MEFRKSSYCQMESCVEAGAEAWAASSYSFSNGNCVEAAGAQFAKAAASGTGSCVEAATAPFTRADASNPHGACVEASGATFAPAGASGGGNCVEAATAGYAKADASAGGNCVEAGTADFASADASACYAHCVEAGGAEFTRADASNYNGNCVEADVHDHDGMVFVRDSKITSGADGNFPHLHFPARGWQSGRAVEFTPVPVAQVPLELREIAVSRDHDDDSSWYAVTSGSPQDDGTVLWFDQAEVDAWKLGVQNGEFTLEAHAAA